MPNKQKHLIIFDIDGVIFEPTHRIHHFINGEHEEYYKKAKTDDLLPQGILMCRFFLADYRYDVLFVTGRGDSGQHREDTLFMLRQHVYSGIRNEQLLMREVPAVCEPDSIHKPKMIEAAGYSLDNIFIVFEDRKSIVEAWRDRGITCYQTQRGWDD